MGRRSRCRNLDTGTKGDDASTPTAIPTLPSGDRGVTVVVASDCGEVCYAGFVTHRVPTTTDTTMEQDGAYVATTKSYPGL